MFETKKNDEPTTYHQKSQYYNPCGSIDNALKQDAKQSKERSKK